MRFGAFGKLNAFASLALLSAGAVSTAQAASFQRLCAVPGCAFGTYALGVSADGTTVIGLGYADYWETEQAFRWTAATGTVGLGWLPGTTSSQAMAVSGNGQVIAGWSWRGCELLVPVDSGRRNGAARWPAG